MHCAAENGFSECVSVLLSCGANADAQQKVLLKLIIPFIIVHREDGLLCIVLLKMVTRNALASY